MTPRFNQCLLWLFVVMLPSGSVMAHGSSDPVLQMAWGRASADKLIEFGYSVAWHEYPMAHAICPDEISDISKWLTEIYA